MDDYEDFVRALLPRLLRYATMLTGERELRFRDGRPLTTRRYDQLWKRLGQRLPWVAAQGTSVHWLRPTPPPWVEPPPRPGLPPRLPRPPRQPRTSHYIYIKASLEEVATALAAAR